jgi:hypothetical protein
MVDRRSLWSPQPSGPLGRQVQLHVPAGGAVGLGVQYGMLDS